LPKIWRRFSCCIRDALGVTESIDELDVHSRRSGANHAQNVLVMHLSQDASGREYGSSTHNDAADTKPGSVLKEDKNRLDHQPWERSTMMTKSDTIAAILEFNATADPVFLAGFSNNELDEYLHRLRRLPNLPFVESQAPMQLAPLVAAVAPQTV